MIVIFTTLFPTLPAMALDVIVNNVQYRVGVGHHVFLLKCVNIAVLVDDPFTSLPYISIVMSIENCWRMSPLKNIAPFLEVFTF